MGKKYTMSVNTPDGFVGVEVSKEVYDFDKKTMTNLRILIDCNAAKIIH